MTGEVQDYVAKFQSCFRIKGTKYRSRHELRLFTGTKPFQFVALYLLELLTESKSHHEHILVIAKQLTKFKQAIVLKFTMSQKATDAFLQYWAYAYDIPG